MHRVTSRLTTLSSSDYTVLKGRGILTLRMKRPWPNWRYCRGICLKGQKKTTETTVSFRTGHFHSRSEAISSDERKACVLKMARVIHCCLNFRLNSFCLSSVFTLWRTCGIYIVKNMCVCAHVLTASDPFLHKSEAEVYFTSFLFCGGPGMAASGQERDRNFYSLIVKQEIVAAPVASRFCCLFLSS
jgi:hypothetical protein